MAAHKRHSIPPLKKQQQKKPHTNIQITVRYITYECFLYDDVYIINLLNAAVVQIISAGQMDKNIQGEVVENKLE